MRMQLAVLFAAIVISVAPFGARALYADDSPAPGLPNETDVTIIQVDKYGVYVPNKVYYWSPEMSKQRVAELTAAAQKLRNRKAHIAFATAGDAGKDKRLFIVDITTAHEPSKQAASAGAPPKHDAAQAQAQAPEGSSPPEAGVKPPEEKPGMQTASVTPPEPPRRPEAIPPGEAVRQPMPPASEGPITKEEARRLVSDIMELSQNKDLDNILLHYADLVDYYNRGSVNLEYIKRDMRYYFRNWDTIRCSVDDDVSLTDSDRPGVKTVRFTSSFYVENSKKYVIGSTDNTWKVERINGQLKIVDQKQEIISSETH